MTVLKFRENVDPSDLKRRILETENALRFVNAEVVMRRAQHKIISKSYTEAIKQENILYRELSMLKLLGGNSNEACG